MELHPKALELVDDEASALVGIEFVGWLAPDRQRQFWNVRYCALLGCERTSVKPTDL